MGHKEHNPLDFSMEGIFSSENMKRKPITIPEDAISSAILRAQLLTSVDRHTNCSWPYMRANHGAKFNNKHLDAIQLHL